MSKKNINFIKQANIKIGILLLCLLLVFTIILFNVSYLAVTGRHFYSGEDILATKDGSNRVVSTISANRGFIYDRNSNILAQDIDTYNIYLVLNEDRITYDYDSNNNTIEVPAYITDVHDTAKQLSAILDIKEESIISMIEAGKANNAYQIELGNNGRNLTRDIKDKIDSLNIVGVEFTRSSTRVYPYNKFASHLLGYAQFEDLIDEDGNNVSRSVGKMGLEYYFDKTLMGTNGYKSYIVDVNNNQLPGTEQLLSDSYNGYDVYLTLDKDIQLSLEDALNKLMIENSATKAWGVVMEAKTGKILGWASYPTFDLNDRDIDNYIDYVNSYAFECGSVMKPFTYASAIDLGVYDGSATFKSGKYYMGVNEDQTFYRVEANDPRIVATIGDAMGRDYGIIDYDEGLVRSTNTGILSLLETALDPAEFEKYLDKFGFFKKVGVLGVEETNGTKVFNYATEKATTAFGQGSTVTTLQLMQAYTAIFNDGTMVKPYVIDRIINPNNNEIINKYETQVISKPIKKETSEQVVELMGRVVSEDYGTGHALQLNNGVNIAAKTGTGQVALESGGYSPTIFTSSIVAGAPSEDPEVIFFYAFESANYYSFSRKPITDSMTEILSIMNITGSDNELDKPDSSFEKYERYLVPNMINHSLSFANSKVDSFNINKIVIGDGDRVINQYPSNNEYISSKSNLFILTDGNKFKMPNMSGWSRKDVEIYKQFTNFNITITGSGTVVKQSVDVNSDINTNTKISVELN